MSCDHKENNNKYCNETQIIPKNISKNIWDQKYIQRQQ